MGKKSECLYLLGGVDFAWKVKTEQWFLNDLDFNA